MARRRVLSGCRIHEPGLPDPQERWTMTAALHSPGDFRATDMNWSTIFIAASFLTPLAPAQIRLEFETSRAFAEVQTPGGPRSQLDVPVPAGPSRAEVRYENLPSRSVASARNDVSFFAPRFDFESSAGGSLAQAARGESEATIRLVSSGWARGQIDLHLELGSVAFSSGTAHIDVGADGTRDLELQNCPQHTTCRQASTLDIVVNAQGLPIETHSAVDVTPISQVASGLRGSGSIEYQTWYEFVLEAVSCGPTAAVTAIQPGSGLDQVDLRFEQAPPQSLGFMALGLQRASTPLPAGCFLLVDPLVIVPIPVDPMGSALVTLPLPQAGSFATFFVQGWFATPGSSPVWTTTPRLALQYYR